MSKGWALVVWFVTIVGTAMWVSAMWKMSVLHQSFGDPAGDLFTLGMAMTLLAAGIIVRET